MGICVGKNVELVGKNCAPPAWAPVKILRLGWRFSTGLVDLKAAAPSVDLPPVVRVMT